MSIQQIELTSLQCHRLIAILKANLTELEDSKAFYSQNSNIKEYYTDEITEIEILRRQIERQLGQ